MVEKTIQRLTYIVSIAPQLLKAIDEDKMSLKISADKWSKKEILGHLIDSATNNHQRFVRAQFENISHKSYDQNNWNAFNHYQELDNEHIIDFWALYNRQLIEVIQRIPNEKLKSHVQVDENIVTLALLIDDYLAHLEHHLKQIINY